MKKQIFILVFFVLTVFTNATTVYGQAHPGLAPRPISCVDDALHPIAGKPYDYKVTVNPGGGNYQWWATTNTEFLKTVAGTTSTNILTKLTAPVATELVNTSANYGTVGTSNTVSITWSDAILNGTKFQVTPTFVAVLYNGSTACADNLKVYELDPIKAFTVDITNIEDGTKATLVYDAPESQCIDNLRSAKYVTGKMEYDYGVNTLYYEVIAANFTGSWTPTFKLSGLRPIVTPVQTAVIQWTYDKPSTWVPATVWNTATTVVTTDELNTSTGVSIYVRVVITNNNYEGTGNTSITLAVDGQNSVGDWDIANNTVLDASPSCTPTTGNDEADIAIQTINKRPTVATGTAVDPTDITNKTLIPGNEKN